jgi:hypothetical protein
LTVTVNGSPLSQYYVQVQGADTTAFSTGNYALALNFGNGTTPVVPSAITPIANGNPLSGGGGIADSPGDSDSLLNSVPLITGISPDTGLSTNDGVTDVPNLDIIGQAPEGTTIQVYANGQFVGSTITGQGNSTGQANESTTWTFDNTGTTLPDGTYSFTATATDSMGNVSAMSFPYTVIVNTQAPAPPVISGISPDTGVSASDGITNVKTPTVAGTALANSMVTISRNGQVVGTSFTDSTGAWTYASTALADGTYSFTATDTNLAGDVSASSTPYLVTIDTTVSPPIIGGVARGTDPVSHTATLLVEGTASAGGTIVLYSKGAAIGTTVADTSGNWSYNYAPGVGIVSGVSSFAAIVTDVAGNVSGRSNVFKLAIGPSAPASSTPLLINGIVIGPSGNGKAIFLGQPIFAGLATPGSVVTILDGDTILGTTTANAFGFWVFDTSSFTSGKHTITAEATDASGVTGLLSNALTFTV